MGNLVFQATLGGQVNLVGPNTASTFNLNVPATSSTIATLTGTETFTNKTLTAPTLASANLTTALTIASASGTAGQVLTSGGSGNAPTWSTVAATPGGSTTQLQYNNAGAFGGISGVTTDGTRMTASTTIGVGAATPSTSGSGITFPATQSASTNANTLDDYEEGTWTPTDGSGAGLSLTVNSASYIKIGQMVFLAASISYPANASGTNANIAGFPFTCTPTGSTGYWGGNGVRYSDYGVPALISVNGNATNADIFSNSGSGIQNVSLSTKRNDWVFMYRANA